jgi:hypothetical protein
MASPVNDLCLTNIFARATSQPDLFVGEVSARSDGGYLSYSTHSSRISVTMARRGVWELQEILLRYSRTGGSSRGVREFVEHDLVGFARDNPQIKIETSFRNSHPFVVGSYGACG